MVEKPLVLSIAGLDPSGGAGVLADVRTIAAFDCAAAAAITSITFQNDEAVLGAEHLSPKTVRQQILAVAASKKIRAVKTGMLPTEAIVREVTALCREKVLPPPILDPVMTSSSGYSLMDEAALVAFVNDLVPRSLLVTPNIPEAERLIDKRIHDVEGMKRAARVIRDFGPRAVLIKGGHLAAAAKSGEAVDVLLDEEGQFELFTAEWTTGASVRGTGCMLASAIAACIAKGKSLKQSVAEAKQFVAGIIEKSR